MTCLIITNSSLLSLIISGVLVFGGFVGDEDRGSKRDVLALELSLKLEDVEMDSTVSVLSVISSSLLVCCGLFLLEVFPDSDAELELDLDLFELMRDVALDVRVLNACAERRPVLAVVVLA